MIYLARRAIFEGALHGTRANSSYLSFLRELLSGPTDFIRMQIGGRLYSHNIRAQWPRVGHFFFFFFCARGRLARKKSKRTGGEMAIPIPRTSKGILALKNTESRELFRSRDAPSTLGCPRCLNALAWGYQGDEERKILWERLWGMMFSTGYVWNLFENFDILFLFALTFFEAFSSQRVELSGIEREKYFSFQ